MKRSRMKMMGIMSEETEKEDDIRGGDGDDE